MPTAVGQWRRGPVCLCHLFSLQLGHLPELSPTFRHNEKQGRRAPASRALRVACGRAAGHRSAPVSGKHSHNRETIPDVAARVTDWWPSDSQNRLESQECHLSTYCVRFCWVSRRCCRWPRHSHTLLRWRVLVGLATQAHRRGQ